MKETEENKNSQDPAQAGDKTQKEKPSSSPHEKEKESEELSPEADSKKEEISGYNEHPDQAKVGGG